MVTTHSEFADRLVSLYTKVSKEQIEQKALEAELNALLVASDSFYVQDKLRSALEWSGVYFSPRRWQKWGDISRVKSFLLSDIQKSKIAVLSRA